VRGATLLLSPLGRDSSNPTPAAHPDLARIPPDERFRPEWPAHQQLQDGPRHEVCWRRKRGKPHAQIPETRKSPVTGNTSGVVRCLRK
jgi:hypothetical protein